MHLPRRTRGNCRAINAGSQGLSSITRSRAVLKSIDFSIRRATTIFGKYLQSRYADTFTVMQPLPGRAIKVSRLIFLSLCGCYAAAAIELRSL